MTKEEVARYLHAVADEILKADGLIAFESTVDRPTNEYRLSDGRSFLTATGVLNYRIELSTITRTERR